MPLWVPGSTAGNSWLHHNEFPSPFFDAASFAVPTDPKTLWKWCEGVWYMAGMYRSAMERVISYFVTDIDVRGIKDEISSDEKEKWTQYLKSPMISMLSRCAEAAANELCYGNFFVSLIVPFVRMMQSNCSCGIQIKHETFTDPYGPFKAKWENFSYTGYCPRCHKTTKWEMVDVKGDVEKELFFKFWSPHEIEVIPESFFGQAKYVWQIPSDYKADIKRGSPLVIRYAPKSVIEAVKQGRDYMFQPDALFHGKEPTLAGMRNASLGIPRMLWLFRHIWYLQVLYRYNEALAMDYVIPFRLITPAPQSSGGNILGDPLLTDNLGDFSDHVRAMIRRRRRDPLSWHTLPFPVQYQSLGGEARNLAPADLIEIGRDDLLVAAQVPLELHKGQISAQGALTGLRLFESSWNSLTNLLNRFLFWAGIQISEALSWEAVICSLRPPTHADDAARQLQLLQLATGQLISQQTALRPLDIDWKHEQRQIAEEAKFQQEQQARIQEEAMQSAFSTEVAKGNVPGMQPPMGPLGAAPAGGPAPGGGEAPMDPSQQAAAGMGLPTGVVLPANVPTNPVDMMAEADSIAQQLLGATESEKRRVLRDLKAKNELMHSYVKQRMQQIRYDFRSQGGSQLLQQTFGRA